MSDTAPFTLELRDGAGSNLRGCTVILPQSGCAFFGHVGFFSRFLSSVGLLLLFSFNINSADQT